MNHYNDVVGSMWIVVLDRQKDSYIKVFYCRDYFLLFCSYSDVAIGFGFLPEIIAAIFVVVKIEFSKIMVAINMIKAIIFMLVATIVELWLRYKKYLIPIIRLFNRRYSAEDAKI